ncbi:MAG: GNAT family N-acetyltransferase [Eubacteriaceae bacterium]|nr:GNAT family N-acetyltransferase [Eubacteriaceae bacterium]
MNIKLEPVNESNRDAVLALSVREDQPFVAPNEASLREADETNEEYPGVARPFAICADGTLVGFCMFSFAPEEKDPAERYWLWRFMIDSKYQDKGFGKAALQQILRYFRDNGADRLYLSTEPENEKGLHLYHGAGFRETGEVCGDEIVLMRMLTGPRRIIRNIYGVDVDGIMRIRGKKGYGVSVAVLDEDDDLHTYCSGSARFGEDRPVRPDTLFQAGSVSKPMFAMTLLRYADKGLIDPDADISGVVPEFVRRGPVSFAALLSHTAGYNLHGFPGYPALHEELSLEDVLSGKGNTPKLRRIRPCGAQHMYSGGGITLAELAFTRITGTTLREAFRKEVAGPLELAHTGYFQPLPDELVPAAAFGGRLGLKEDPEHGYHYYPEHAAAGLWSTPTDLAKAGIALSRSYQEGGFLKKETARRMMSPVMDDYGLCLYVWDSEAREDTVAGHGGENRGFLTSWVFSLTKDLCVTVMYNNVTEAADEGMDDISCGIFKYGLE